MSQWDEEALVVEGHGEKGRQSQGGPATGCDAPPLRHAQPRARERQEEGQQQAEAEGRDAPPPPQGEQPRLLGRGRKGQAHPREPGPQLLPPHNAPKGQGTQREE
eukprot:565908-Amphidinium_carterae.3